MKNDFFTKVENLTAEITALEIVIQNLPEERYKRILPAVFDVLIEMARTGNFKDVRTAIARIKHAAFANAGPRKYQPNG